MGSKELLTKVTAIRENEQMIALLQAEIDTMKDEIKAEMTASGREEMTSGTYTIRYKDVTSSRLDGARLKKERPELHAMYQKSTTSKRFTIS